MSTAAATEIKPATTDSKPPKFLAHLFCKCTRGLEVRISFCGISKAVGDSKPYNPDMVDPDLCVVCIELRHVEGCKRCGNK